MNPFRHRFRQEVKPNHSSLDAYSALLARARGADKQRRYHLRVTEAAHAQYLDIQILSMK